MHLLDRLHGSLFEIIIYDFLRFQVYNVGLVTVLDMHVVTADKGGFAKETGRPRRREPW